jgi:ribonuclease PH
VDLDNLGERTLYVDCDVLEADGGTRTASVTAGWVALALACDRLYANGLLRGPVLRDQIAAISVGHVDGALALDLCYEEDSKARVDMNVVGTASGSVVEIQATAEGRAVPRKAIDEMTDLAFLGIQSLCAHQRSALQGAGVPLDRVLRPAAITQS